MALGITWGKKDANDSVNTSAIIELKASIAALDGKIMALARDGDRITRLEERYSSIVDKLGDIAKKLDNPPWTSPQRR